MPPDVPVLDGAPSVSAGPTQLRSTDEGASVAGGETSAGGLSTFVVPTLDVAGNVTVVVVCEGAAGVTSRAALP